MYRRRLCAPLLLLVATFQACTAASAAGSPIRDVMADVINDFIRPGYARFHAAAEQLNGRIDALCEMPSRESLAVARETFSDAVVAWAGIEMVRFGPVTAENRFERVLFYPDPRGTGLKQLQAMFAGSGGYPQTLDDLVAKSVAVQGLSALEYALYGTGSDILSGPDGARRCHYAALVALNLKTIGGELDTAWRKPDGIADVWMHPGPSNRVLHDEREALAQILGVLVHGTETIRDVRLQSFLRETPEKDKPRLALFWRSQNTLPAIGAYLRGLKDLFDNGNMATMLPEADRQIAEDIRRDLDTAIGITADIGDPIEAALADPGQREKLERLRATLSDLKKRFSQDYGDAIGLSAGFSFVDGD
ncbi:imelysin family protein [Oricola nitratireducens]|uniref:imelysin family protein n=1 Tax=Oricola nitratireducens TaxID=2775868 RepID=UPI001866C0A7|nr:imelysin family protein [Oricola nitratireducens]